MAATILYSPSKEELENLAKDFPELNQELKQKVLQETQAQALKYVQKKIQNQASVFYDKLFSSIKADLFKSGYSGNNTGFSDAKEKELIRQIELLFSESIQEEMNAILNSEDFKKELRVEFKRKMLASVMKSLESEINLEAKKLVS